jgi:hypothetical protein
MPEAYTLGIAYDGIHNFPAEMRREIYDALQLKVTVSPNGMPRYQGFANAQIIRLTRAVEEYGHEVEQCCKKPRVGGKPSFRRRDPLQRWRRSLGSLYQVDSREQRVMASE